MELTNILSEEIEELQKIKLKLIKRLIVKWEYEGLSQGDNILKREGAIITYDGNPIARNNNIPIVPIKEYEEARNKIGALGNDFILIASLIGDTIKMYQKLHRLKEQAIVLIKEDKNDRE